MELILFILLLALLVSQLRLPVFEVTFSVILCAPIFGYLFLYTGGSPVLGLISGVLITLLAIKQYQRALSHQAAASLNHMDEFFPILIFSAAFYLLHLLTLQWSQFYPIGERLRDFAVLSATINNPLSPQEPWLAGHQLNYYLYWYRFGFFWSNAADLQNFEIYHRLVAFAEAFYLTSCFVIFRKLFKLDKSSAFLFSLILALGSNLVGIPFVLSPDLVWWNISRVIPGSINEFPAWSFILGDLHPHYLNMGVMPFAFLLIAQLLPAIKSFSERLVTYLLFSLLLAAFLFNANAWELPIFGLLFAISSFYLLYRQIWHSQHDSHIPHFGLKIMRYFIILSFSAALIFALYLSSRNILPSNVKLRSVAQAASTSEPILFLCHWGVPIFVILLTYLFSIKNVWKRSSVLTQILGFTALSLLIFPELFFFDDPYGGPNQRMNTIFKFYMQAWFFIHAYAIALIVQSELYQKARLKVKIVSQIFVCAVMIAFFTKSAVIRSNFQFSYDTDSAGLEKIEHRFPGAKDTITYLKSAPVGIVLEAPGNPYDYTAFIATLSAKPAFLGWANHMFLLSGDRPEVKRRQAVQQAIYTATSCSTLKEILQQEQITYLVVGPLELNSFPNLKNIDLTCLTEELQVHSFRIFSPKT